MLRRLFLSVLAGLCLAAAPALWADTVPRVIVMQVDEDLDALPRGTALTAELSAVIAETFTDNGLSAVVDIDAIPELSGRRQLTTAELLDHAARLSDPPADVVVLFTAFASAQADPFAPGVMKMQSRLTGRLVHASSRDSLGVYTAGPVEAPLEQGCDRACIMEEVARQTTLLAREVGQTLALKLTSE
jgi:hypothetical protein